jgi:hypothetical protein
MTNPFVAVQGFFMDDVSNGLHIEELYESEGLNAIPRVPVHNFTWASELTIWQSSLTRTTSSSAPSVNNESPEKGELNPADPSSASNVKRK